MLGNSTRKIVLSSMLGAALMLSGCGKDQILLKTYSPPKKQKEVKQMLTVGESSTGYLNIEIYDDIKYIQNNVKDSATENLAKSIISDIKNLITQTNFISINDVADQSAVSLDMKIIQLNYKTTANSIDGLIEVEFNIRKDEPLYTQTYQYKIKRFSRSGRQGLPTKLEIVTEASKYLAKKFIKDISPLQTRKLVEFASLPSELEYTIEYAKGGNFAGAIKAMNKYKGDKDYEYYLDLAIFYEGLAAKEDEMGFLSKANDNYELAMQKGSDEDIVVKAKMKFDNSYKIIKKIAEQRVQNAKENGNSKYELLD